MQLVTSAYPQGIGEVGLKRVAPHILIEQNQNLQQHTATCSIHAHYDGVQLIPARRCSVDIACTGTKHQKSWVRKINLVLCSTGWYHMLQR